jgi:hypothetical protein
MSISIASAVPVMPALAKASASREFLILCSRFFTNAPIVSVPAPENEKGRETVPEDNLPLGPRPTTVATTLCR